VEAGDEIRVERPNMISPSEMYFASTPVITLKANGCWRFRDCPRAGGGGRLISFNRPKAVHRMWLTPEIAEFCFTGNDHASKPD
jgi:hypothetical protein